MFVGGISTRSIARLVDQLLFGSFFRLNVPQSTAWKEPGIAFSRADGDFWQIVFEDAPLYRGERNNCQAPSDQVLFEVKRLISCNQYFKLVIFCRIEQSAVLEAFPPFVAGSKYFVGAEIPAQTMIQIFVEQYFHARRCSS